MTTLTPALLLRRFPWTGPVSFVTMRWWDASDRRGCITGRENMDRKLYILLAFFPLRGLRGLPSRFERTSVSLVLQFFERFGFCDTSSLLCFFYGRSIGMETLLKPFGIYIYIRLAAAMQKITKNGAARHRRICFLWVSLRTLLLFVANYSCCLRALFSVNLFPLYLFGRTVWADCLGGLFGWRRGWAEGGGGRGGWAERGGGREEKEERAEGVIEAHVAGARWGGRRGISDIGTAQPGLDLFAFRSERTHARTLVFLSLRPPRPVTAVGHEIPRPPPRRRHVREAESAAPACRAPPPQPALPLPCARRRCAPERRRRAHGCVRAAGRRRCLLRRGGRCAVRRWVVALAGGRRGYTDGLSGSGGGRVLRAVGAFVPRADRRAGDRHRLEPERALDESRTSLLRSLLRHQTCSAQESNAQT